MRPTNLLDVGAIDVHSHVAYQQYAPVRQVTREGAVHYATQTKVLLVYRQQTLHGAHSLCPLCFDSEFTGRDQNVKSIFTMLQVNG